MWWLTIAAWVVAVGVFCAWLGRWRFAGGLTAGRYWRECRRTRRNMQGLTFWAGWLALVTWPFSVVLDLAPPEVLPLQIPLAVTAILGTTGPVSFLILGSAQAGTVDLCATLGHRFPLLRAGVALDPLKLGAIADHALGPTGNLWTSETFEPWTRQISRLIEDAPLIIFDARALTPHTEWELQRVLLSPDLPKLIIVGPIGDERIAAFFERFDCVPVVADRVLPDVISTATPSRACLLKWYERRRTGIARSLQRLAGMPGYLIAGHLCGRSLTSIVAELRTLYAPEESALL